MPISASHYILLRKTVEYNYMLHDHKLEVTTDSKYLGVTISNDLSWATHITSLPKPIIPSAFSGATYIHVPK